MFSKFVEMFFVVPCNNALFFFVQFLTADTLYLII